MWAAGEERETEDQGPTPVDPWMLSCVGFLRLGVTASSGSESGNRPRGCGDPRPIYRRRPACFRSGPQRPAAWLRRDAPRRLALAACSVTYRPRHPRPLQKLVQPGTLLSPVRNPSALLAQGVNPPRSLLGSPVGPRERQEECLFSSTYWFIFLYVTDLVTRVSLHVVSPLRAE